MEYKVPEGTRIGHVHLKVSYLRQSPDFYCGLLGFEITQKYGNSAAFISAGGYHHHIGLNVWHSKNAAPGPTEKKYRPGHSILKFCTLCPRSFYYCEKTTKFVSLNK